MPHRRPSFSELEQRIGYRFRDQALLKEALTHSSFKTRDDDHDLERLEFLGDRVLGLWAASLVVGHEARDGIENRARAYNRLVCADTCAEVAKSIDLGAFVIMAGSEARSGGRKKTVILADACEALLGAVYIDGGAHAANQVVTRLWDPYVQDALSADKDAKTALQEYAQKRRLGLPHYEIVSRSGADHAPFFIVEAHVQGLQPAQGSGSSLKKAQQAAAEALLARETAPNGRASENDAPNAKL